MISQASAQNPMTIESSVAIADEESRSWFRTASLEKRAAIRELMQVRPIWNLIAGLFVAMWFGAGMVALTMPAWPVRLAAYCVIALAIHGLNCLLHEAIHGNLFRNRRLDYWLGFFSAMPSLMSVTAYRVTHLPHHWYNRTERDPGEIMNLSKSGRVLSAVFYGWLVVGMLFVVLTMPFASRPWARPHERRMIAAEYAALGGLIAALVLLGIRYDFLEALGHVWGLPLIFAALIGNVRGRCEHMLTLSGHPLHQSRTVTSNGLVSLLFVNANFHLEHHLFPGMPWYNLPKLHALLQEEYREAGTYTYKSYIRFLLDAALIGVHGLAPKHVRLPERLVVQATGD